MLEVFLLHYIRKNDVRHIGWIRTGLIGEVLKTLLQLCAAIGLTGEENSYEIYRLNALGWVAFGLGVINSILVFRMALVTKSGVERYVMDRWVEKHQ